jgi:peptide/nickel transport system ATP-binding protein
MNSGMTSHSSVEAERGSDRGPTVASVRDLRVRYGRTWALRGVSLDIEPGEVLGIAGESGSGKSTFGLALMGLLPRQAEVAGRVEIGGDDVSKLAPRPRRLLRGDRIAMIFQDPFSTLNPVRRVGSQIVEAMRVHGVPKREAHARGRELFQKVGLRDVALFDAYPHELSGGMRQRVLIAIAMANAPDLVVADEPTTALDATVQAQILDLLRDACKETNTSLVLITHDLGVTARYADRMAIMYAGKVVELGRTEDVYDARGMPYTRALLASVPVLGSRAERLEPIPGSVPQLAGELGRCAFAERCSFSVAACEENEPELLPIERRGHAAACFRPPAWITETSLAEPAVQRAVDRQTTEHAARASESVLVVDDVVKTYEVRAAGGFGRSTRQIAAVRGVTFRVDGGEVFGIVGESGCGKSTLARCLAGLASTTSGSVWVAGTDESTPRTALRNSQLVFQEPLSSLDPRWSVEQIIDEPLRLGGVPSGERLGMTTRLLDDVGLPADVVGRYPHEFSGGQQQRIVVARALATNPSLLVMDEPVSSLDASVQAGVLNLIRDSLSDKARACVFITHDLAVAEYVSDRIAVMYLGQFVEVATVGELFARPLHPYTTTLLSSVAVADPSVEKSRSRVLPIGEPPNQSDTPAGCAFRSRCPRYHHELDAAQRRRCDEVAPSLQLQATGSDVACHFTGV